MYTLLVILICLVAVLMICIVLIQESKGGGLSSSFASYNQIGGVRKTTDFIEKTTWSLAAAMVIISVACAYVAPQAVHDSSVMENIENPTTNPNNLPGFGASQTKEAAPAAGQKAAPAPAPKAAPAATPAGGTKVTSPLPGSVIKVLVSEGQAVKKGDTLLTLESMKMENAIMAECDGTVSKIAVTAGQNVMQDDLLVILN